MTSSDQATAMSFKVEAADRADIPQMVDIFYNAFDEDRIVGAMERHVDAKLRAAEFAKFFESQLDNSHLLGSRLYKITDTTKG